MFNKCSTWILIIVALAMSSILFAKPPATVSHVNLKQYMGKWYEIASFPNWFQKGCRCTTAQYQLEGQNVYVLNSCYKGKDLKHSTATARAWAVDKSNSKLKVQFFWPFRGDYWILYLTPQYQQVIIGAPKRNYLWILSRQKKISPSLYNKLVGIARQDGFDTSKLHKTNQNCQFKY